MKEGKYELKTANDFEQLMNSCTEEEKEKLFDLINSFLKLNNCEQTTAVRLVRLAGNMNERKNQKKSYKQKNQYQINVPL